MAFISETLATDVGKINQRRKFPYEAQCVTADIPIRIGQMPDGSFRCGERRCYFNTEGEEGEVLVVSQRFGRNGWQSIGVCHGVEKKKQQVLSEGEAEEAENVG